MSPDTDASLWSEIGAAIAGFVAALGGMFGLHKRAQRKHECRFDGDALARASREDTDRLIATVIREGKQTREAIYGGFHDMGEKLGAQAVELAVLKERVRSRHGRSRDAPSQ